MAWHVHEDAPLGVDILLASPAFDSEFRYTARLVHALYLSPSFSSASSGPSIHTYGRPILGSHLDTIPSPDRPLLPY